MTYSVLLRIVASRIVGASACFTLLAGAAWGQWTATGCSPSGAYCLTSGNAGIGTTNPSQLLSVGSGNQFTVSSTGAMVTTGGISSPDSSGSGGSERFGSNASASSFQSLAVGGNASAADDYSTAIGHNAYAAGGTAVGSGASATGPASAAIGFISTASGDFSSAVGGAATGAESVAIGYGSTANGAYSLAVNFGANVQAEGGVGIGGFATVAGAHYGSMAFGYQATTTAANQLVVGGAYRYISDIYFGKGVFATSPVAVAINSNGASGTDSSGANLVLAAGKATGAGVGGDLLFSSSDAGASGTSLQGLSAKMIIKDSGSVGIGTTSPCTSYAPTNCKLSVSGAIQAKEVVVNTGWSDYVFAPGYKLAPLSEVAAYVAENHHLPNIPSAADVAEKGISLGDMQAKLLAKVEELTLHMIEMEERNKTLDEKNGQLQDRIALLEEAARKNQ